MSVLAPSVPPAARSRALGPYVLVLLLALASGILIHMAVGVAMVVIGLLLLARPLDPVVALVVATAAASFVNNEGGHLTRDFAVVSLLGTYALICFAAWMLSGRWLLPRGRLVLAILALFLMVVLGTVRGVLAGNSARYLGLELLPLLSLGLAIAIGGLRLTKTQMSWSLVILCLTGLAHVGLAMVSYAVNQIRTGGLSFTPFPALAALLTFNLLLREERPGRRVLLFLVTGLFLMHQVVSFTRGYWLGLLVAIPYSCFLYAGLRDGARARWMRIARTFATIAIVVCVSTLAVSFVFGWSNLPALLVTRFASSVGTEQSSETASNVARLIEYWSAIQHIARSPWLGYGLGFTMHTREAIFGTVTSQWFIHQNYLYIWLKLGVVGLLAFVMTLWEAFWNGTRLATSRGSDGTDAAWGAAAAGGTIHMAVVALTNFNLAQVNGTVFLAFLWGVSLARTTPERTRFVWRLPASDEQDEPRAGSDW